MGRRRWAGTTWPWPGRPTCCATSWRRSTARRYRAPTRTTSSAIEEERLAEASAHRPRGRGRGSSPCSTAGTAATTCRRRSSTCWGVAQGRPRGPRPPRRARRAPGLPAPGRKAVRRCHRAPRCGRDLGRRPRTPRGGPGPPPALARADEKVRRRLGERVLAFGRRGAPSSSASSTRPRSGPSSSQGELGLPSSAAVAGGRGRHGHSPARNAAAPPTWPAPWRFGCATWPCPTPGSR